MIKISASILSGKDDIVSTLNEYNNLLIDYIHLDVMDGKFVSNVAFNKLVGVQSALFPQFKRVEAGSSTISLIIKILRGETTLDEIIRVTSE